ncbi:asparagine synthase (glutamine-hydrolyzing) [Cesiribacter andamanensis]|uniref:asparagine synthase (glutamine-hydrolyzing) n=1 Tax=Cesiribacter andamanensis AMV16 TaxID=1279009 RepID=M7N8X1_9BACT|nr:asparagine synthase (glutamine-hydrolyzing) [Cesiribacter andamanensis]EMR03702.1 Asparagine synthetase [glutamine-hydrolyzing] 1 [Cesiribacter andamanensis AMV16]
MCGLVGFISFDKREQLQQHPPGALACIRHRGPDARGEFAEGPVWLGHARLSILDPTAAANQPMQSRCGRWVLIYNGELYNFKELASQLDVPLQTQSDTEVLLEGIARRGMDFVKQCRGMFAFALYDRQQQVLHLCRDQLGIKPLFIAQTGKTLLFASELKAITGMAAGLMDLSLNLESIKKFLHLGYIPRPATIYREVEKMAQGSLLQFSAAGLQRQTYWRLEDVVRAEVSASSEGEAKQALKGLLQCAIGSQMISDVPFGSLLSGGIDSSLVTAVAQSVSASPVNTFSVGLENKQADESRYAAEIARTLGTQHHTLMVSPKECLDIVEELLGLYDEPYADSSAFPTYLVARFASRHVKMVLAGDGGDELFMGYGMYTWASRLAHPAIRHTKALWPPLLKRMSPTYQRAATLFEPVAAQDLPAHIFSQEQYFFTAAEIEALVDLPGSSALPYTNALARSLSPAEQQAFFDLQYYLPDDLLVKVDRASMANSLEVRPPLLDLRLLEFAVNLPEDLRKRGGTTKYLLKEVLYDYVPRRFFDRPKRGFSIPLQQWLKGELRYLLSDYLNPEVLKRYPFIDSQKVQAYLQAYLGGKDYLYNRLWLLVVLVYWLENHNHAKT